MCDINEQDKLRVVPIMLKGDAMNYYANNSASCNSFDDAMKILRECYNSDDRKARILTQWQSMSLSEAMRAEPDEAEVTVFRKFTASLMSLQQKLDKSYHSDTFLRDRLLTAIYIPVIQSSLRDSFPRSSQQAINRFAIQLSERKRSAGKTAACITKEEASFDEARYSLDRSYGGEARRAMRRPHKEGGERRHSNNGRNRDIGGRRLNSAWMRGVKGCFVCGQNHRANTRHSLEEVTKAINKLKERHPMAFLTVENLQSVFGMATGPNEDDHDEEEDDEVLWNEE